MEIKLAWSKRFRIVKKPFSMLWKKKKNSTSFSLGNRQLIIADAAGRKTICLHCRDDLSQGWGVGLESRIVSDL